MSAPQSREQLRQQVVAAELASQAAQRALEAAQQALSEHADTPDGQAEDWMLRHGIAVEPNRDNEGEPLRGEWIVTTDEILDLANRLVLATDNERASKQ